MRRLFLLLGIIACGGDAPKPPPVQAPPVVVVPPVPVVANPCDHPARVVVTVEKSELVVGETTHAHATVYDSASRILTGCKVVWSVK